MGKPGKKGSGGRMDAEEPGAPGGKAGEAPARGGLILASLILVAAVANLNLAVANVALPSIGKAFNSSQTALNLVAVGYSLGLAASVLYFGALGDRYGRKMMLIAGTALAIPASLLAAYAPSDSTLFAARVLGGLAAGMAFPTTLALITVLWSGPARTRSIALWSGLGGAIAALGPFLSGLLLKYWWWGSVFLITLPLAAVAMVMSYVTVPAHVKESDDPVDNPGGVLTVIFVGALVIGINFITAPGMAALALGFLGVSAVSAAAFVLRERRAANPLYDLEVAGRRVFWVAACAGIIVFGALMGAMFIGQQYLQNVLDYSTLGAGVAILPGVVFMVIIAPISARLVEARGARFTLLTGYWCILGGFLVMLFLWGQGASYWPVGLGYALVGAGVGFAGTPASHSLTGSVPVRRAGMASATADLQRDLGGAIVQSIMGALLAAGYASTASSLIAAAPETAKITEAVRNQLVKSFSGASAISGQYPEYSDRIIEAARQSFLSGDHRAYLAGIALVLAGAALVFFAFPKMEEEERLLRRYNMEDAGKRR